MWFWGPLSIGPHACLSPFFPTIHAAYEKHGYALTLSGWHDSKWGQCDNRQCHEKVFISLLDHCYRHSCGGMAMKFQVHAPDIPFSVTSPFCCFPYSHPHLLSESEGAWFSLSPEPRGTYPLAVAGEDSPCGQSVLEGVLKGSNTVLFDEMLAKWSRRMVCLFAYFISLPVKQRGWPLPP